MSNENQTEDNTSVPDDHRIGVLQFRLNHLENVMDTRHKPLFIMLETVLSVAGVSFLFIGIFAITDVAPAFDFVGLFHLYADVMFALVCVLTLIFVIARSFAEWLM